MKIKTCICIGAFLMVSMLRAQGGFFKVVVHASNPVASISKEDVVGMFLFLKKMTTWKNGEKVSPVDLADNSPERDRLRLAGGARGQCQRQGGRDQRLMGRVRIAPDAVFTTAYHRIIRNGTMSKRDAESLRVPFIIMVDFCAPAKQALDFYPIVSYVIFHITNNQFSI
jgi:hypothetical protein